MAVAHCGDWLMRALARGWSFEYLPRAYVYYRQHGATISSASLRDDVQIAEAITILDRYGYTLSRRELVCFHTRRGYHVLRRLGRGVVQRDVRRVALSWRTWTRLGRHLVKQLAS